MKAVYSLLITAIFIYVGINLLPGMNTVVATITTPTYNSGVAGMMAVVLIVFAAMLVFGIVAAMKDSFS
jgi:ABC-type sulfate transport system permease subunit